MCRRPARVDLGRVQLVIPSEQGVPVTVVVGGAVHGGVGGQVPE